MESAKTIKLSYILLLVVMGGRTALFASKLDSLLKVERFNINLTPLSVLLAISLILAVSAGAYARGKTTKNERAHRMATQVMYGAAILDGMLNISEAVYLATDSGVFDQFATNKPILYWMWLTTVLIGVGPTALTMGLATLAGEIDRTAAQSKPTVRTRAKVFVEVERTVASNAALDAHLTHIIAQLGPGQQFTREQVEQWTGKSKQHAVNIINYAKAQGVVGDVRRGVYVYSQPTKMLNAGG